VAAAYDMIYCYRNINRSPERQHQWHCLPSCHDKTLWNWHIIVVNTCGILWYVTSVWHYDHTTWHWIDKSGRVTLRLETIQHLILTECLHVPIVGPTGRSDPGYVRLSVRPVGQTGRTDCSRTFHICQSNQC